ncbi:hypothetical protein Pint_11206 [Pistacia integerrima]|uniref:Uncharacterized protein n=1 Tax=Pistacia integerrima TaxID=434235 RepID=A0ACC0XMF0_9ROSI|nr:hypothetical protein Pint_11206 [Pistacia integerrima]
MSTDEVKIDIAPEIESHDKEDELMTSPRQEQGVSDTTIASENSSSNEKLENETSPPQDLLVTF